MGSLFKSTKNTRYLPCSSSKYIRSDVPDCLDKQEIDWLWKNNVCTIIDLRTQAEIEQKPCSLANRSDFTYYKMSVTGGSSVPNKPSHVADSYLNMVDDTMRNIIKFIESSNTNVLYFCNAGKDRTGVVSALLLSRMQIDKRIIIQDYLESANNLSEMLKAYASQYPSINIDVITPHASYMEKFLTELDYKYHTK